jgi:hypothetical protein
MNINDVMERDGKDSVGLKDVSRETLKSESGGLHFLKVPSVDKPIEEYLNHPLNRARDEDLGHGLRGVEAYLGNTKLAIIDLLHLVKYLFKKIPKKELVQDGES